MKNNIQLREWYAKAAQRYPTMTTIVTYMNYMLHYDAVIIIYSLRKSSTATMTTIFGWQCTIGSRSHRLKDDQPQWTMSENACIKRIVNTSYGELKPNNGTKPDLTECKIAESLNMSEYWILNTHGAWTTNYGKPEIGDSGNAKRFFFLLYLRMKEIFRRIICFSPLLCVL